MLEEVFEGDGMSEEVPGYGSDLRLEDHCISAEGVSLALNATPCLGTNTRGKINKYLYGIIS